MSTNDFVGELRQLKGDIQKWFTGRNETHDSDASQVQREAEELIWKLQERYGYTREKQESE